MTFHEWQTWDQDIHRRALALRLQMVARMDATLGAAFGGPPMQASAHLARNWRGQSWLTPEQARAVRCVLHMHERSFEPERLAARITARRMPPR